MIEKIAARKKQDEDIAKKIAEFDERIAFLENQFEIIIDYLKEKTDIKKWLIGEDLSFDDFDEYDFDKYDDLDKCYYFDREEGICKTLNELAFEIAYKDGELTELKDKLTELLDMRKQNRKERYKRNGI